MGITTVWDNSVNNADNTITETPKQKIEKTTTTEKVQLDDALQSDVDVNWMNTFDQSKKEFERFVNNNNTAKVIQWLDAIFQKANSEEEKEQAKTYFLGCIATGIFNNKQDIKKFMETYPNILWNEEIIYSQKRILQSLDNTLKRTKDREIQEFINTLKRYKIGLFWKIKQIFRHKKNFNSERAKIILEDFSKFYNTEKAEEISDERDRKNREEAIQKFTIEKQKYENFLEKWEYEKAIPHLIWLIGNANNEKNIYIAREYLLKSIISWIIKKYADKNQQENLYKLSRTLWFVPWKRIKDNTSTKDIAILLSEMIWDKNIKQEKNNEKEYIEQVINPYIEKYWDKLIEYFNLKTEESIKWERSIIQILNNSKNPAHKIAENLIAINLKEEKNNPFIFDYTKKRKSWRGKNNKKESRRKNSKSKTPRRPKSDNTKKESWRGQDNKKAA